MKTYARPPPKMLGPVSIQFLRHLRHQAINSTLLRRYSLRKRSSPEIRQSTFNYPPMMKARNEASLLLLLLLLKGTHPLDFGRENINVYSNDFFLQNEVHSGTSLLSWWNIFMTIKMEYLFFLWLEHRWIFGNSILKN